MKTAESMRASLKEWLLEHGKLDDPKTLSDDTPIIERRIITSLQVMDLILYLEQLSGRPVDVESLKPGSFRDINAIYDNFLGPIQNEHDNDD